LSFGFPLISSAHLIISAATRIEFSLFHVCELLHGIQLCFRSYCIHSGLENCYFVIIFCFCFNTLFFLLRFKCPSFFFFLGNKDIVFDTNRFLMSVEYGCRAIRLFTVAQLAAITGGSGNTPVNFAKKNGDKNQHGDQRGRKQPVHRKQQKQL
jgi:hypothetical protein